MRVFAPVPKMLADATVYRVCPARRQACRPWTAGLSATAPVLPRRNSSTKSCRNHRDPWTKWPAGHLGGADRPLGRAAFQSSGLSNASIWRS